MTIKEIEAEIQRLRNLRDELSKQEIAELKERAIDNVGRCFIVNGRYVKVIGIPQEQWQLSGRPIFNQYQYPALYLGYDEENSVIPFYYDTLFSGVWGDGHDLLMSIRAGEYQKEDGTYLPEFFEMVNDLEKRLAYAKENTSLPSNPNMKKVEEFVMSVNRRAIDE